jgi:hypothetical protein
MAIGVRLFPPEATLDPSLLPAASESMVGSTLPVVCGKTPLPFSHYAKLLALLFLMFSNTSSPMHDQATATRSIMMNAKIPGNLRQKYIQAWRQLRDGGETVSQSLAAHLTCTAVGFAPASTYKRYLPSSQAPRTARLAQPPPSREPFKTARAWTSASEAASYSRVWAWRMPTART